MLNNLNNKDFLYLLIIFYLCFISIYKLSKIYRNIFKNQFIKLIFLIFLFNIINYNNNIGLLLTILFLIVHNIILNLTIDNNII
jgi:hypothetical protein